MIKLSTALILKNEGTTVYKCLESVKNITDEYVIGIDSKCTDNTEEQVDLFIADNPKTKIKKYIYIWGDSFAEARNEGMDKCTGDWILIMDGHEFIPTNWFNITEKVTIDSQKAMEILKTKLTKTGCLKDDGKPTESDEVFLCLYQQPFLGQTPNNYFMQPRIYRNGKSKLKGHVGKKIRYGRAAHNTIKFSRPELAVHFPEIMIIHDAPEENRKERSIQRGAMNVKQLKEDIKKKPNDSRAYFYLGNTYMELKDFNKALGCYEKYRKYQEFEHSEYYQCLLNTAISYRELKELKKARDILGKAVALDPTRRDAIQLLGEVYFAEEDYEKAIIFWNNTLQIPAQASRMFSNGATYTWLPHQSLAMAYKKLDNKEMAIAHLRACLNYANYPKWNDEIKELSEDKKNILIVDHMGSFTMDFQKHLENKDYNVIKVKQLDQYLGMWADSIWVEWADRNAAMIGDFAHKTVIRLHGYEAFVNQSIFNQIRWDCKSVVFVAEHIQDKMQGLVPSLNGQCKVIKNGVDTDKFFIKEYKRDTKAVGYAGFMNVKKNPMRLARIIKDNPNMTFHLRTEWQDNFMKDSFEYETKDCKNIVYHGYYDNLNEFWNKVSYVISTSDIESFSFNVAEGMAAGCEPVIYNWKGAKNIWNKKFIFDDKPKFKKDIDMDKNRDYIINNFPLKESLNAMEEVLVK
jgi:glycosyltransferase involved in cell wall biosynthesis